MTGIFPNALNGGVNAVATVGGYQPATPPIGTAALYHAKSCRFSISPEEQNNIIANLVCAMDRCGIAYNPLNPCGLADAIECLVARGQQIIRAICSSTQPPAPSMGQYWMDSTLLPNGTLRQFTTSGWVTQALATGPLLVICQDCNDLCIYVNTGTCYISNCTPAAAGCLETINNISGTCRLIKVTMGRAFNQLGTLSVVRNDWGVPSAVQDSHNMFTEAGFLELLSGSTTFSRPYFNALALADGDFTDINDGISVALETPSLQGDGELWLFSGRMYFDCDTLPGTTVEFRNGPSSAVAESYGAFWPGTGIGPLASAPEHFYFRRRGGNITHQTTTGPMIVGPAMSVGFVYASWDAQGTQDNRMQLRKNSGPWLNIENTGDLLAAGVKMALD